MFIYSLCSIEWYILANVIVKFVKFENFRIYLSLPMPNYFQLMPTKLGFYDAINHYLSIHFNHTGICFRIPEWCTGNRKWTITVPEIWNTTCCILFDVSTLTDYDNVNHLTVNGSLISVDVKTSILVPLFQKNLSRKFSNYFEKKLWLSIRAHAHLNAQQIFRLKTSGNLRKVHSKNFKFLIC